MSIAAVYPRQRLTCAKQRQTSVQNLQSLEGAFFPRMPSLLQATALVHPLSVQKWEQRSCQMGLHLAKHGPTGWPTIFKSQDSPIRVPGGQLSHLPTVGMDVSNLLGHLPLFPNPDSSSSLVSEQQGP